MPKPTTLQMVASWVAMHPGRTFSMDDLAAQLHAGRSTVARMVAALVRSNVVSRLTGQRGAGHRTSLAIVDGPRLAAVAAGKSRVPTSSLFGTGTRERDIPWSLHPDDFGSAVAIRAAFDRTVAAGLLNDTEAALVRFAAAVARALRVARNACAFVAAFVRGRVPWSFLAAADEDAGRRLIRLGTDAAPKYVLAVVSDIAARAMARLRAAVAPRPIMQTKPILTTHSDQSQPDDVGRRVWCFLHDHKTMAVAAEAAGVPADRAIAAVRAYARARGCEAQLEAMIERGRPKPLKRERAQQ